MTAPDVRDRLRARLLGTGDDAAGVELTGTGIAAFIRREEPLLPDAEVARLAAELAADATGLGPLDPLFADPEVTEVMVNGGAVWVERHGALEPVDVVLDEATVARVVERILGPLGRRADRTAPVADARLPDGSRVCVVIPPVAVDGICVSVRRFAATPVPLSSFCAPPVGALLREMVEDRRNLLVAGGTSAGKTTLLNALAGEIANGERIVTIEDAAELRLPQPHVVRLEARPPNSEGAGGVSVRALLRAALRLRPDRLVIGEVRDGAALDMLQALNTGHAGSFSTCHANSPTDALRRVETMALMGDVDLSLAAVREQIAAAVDVVITVGRGEHGRRSVTEVAEVAGAGFPGRTGWTARPLVSGDVVVATPSRPSRRGEAR